MITRKFILDDLEMFVQFSNDFAQVVVLGVALFWYVFK